MEKKLYCQWVYEVTKQIPEGRVCTYGHIADYLALGSARMVGWALSNAHGEENLPAHRVVNRKGELSGRHHFRPPEAMQERLEMEGITVENHRITDFKTRLWIPSVELTSNEIDL